MGAECLCSICGAYRRSPAGRQRKGAFRVLSAVLSVECWCVPFHRVLSLLTGAAWPFMFGKISGFKGFRKLVVRRLLFCLAQMIAYSFKIRGPKASACGLATVF
ncbi:MAG: hypothetical protein K0S22_764 [Oscillospiraceae bacterium]|nr:hypothetical protein [Oscillospiraceae bacterium]